MVRFIVVENNFYHTKHTFNGRKELKEYLKAHASDVSNIYEITRKTDRYLEYMMEEDERRFIVRINKMYDDEWYCLNVDKQYPLVVFAKDKKEAVDKAMKHLVEQYDCDAEYLELVEVKEYPFEEVDDLKFED